MDLFSISKLMDRIEAAILMENGEPRSDMYAPGLWLVLDMLEEELKLEEGRLDAEYQQYKEEFETH